MICKCPVCRKPKESTEKLASHIKHMSWNKNEPQHISWLDKHNLQPLEITKICAVLKELDDACV